MAIDRCGACNELKENASEFYANGVTTDVCTSLQNNTGLNPANGNDDCTDLDTANDCLIGNLEDEVEAYDICDWKGMFKKLARNIYNIFAAVNCILCGIWKKLKEHEQRLDKHEKWLEKHDCLFDTAFKGARFSAGEEMVEGKSYVVAGKGVSFFLPSGDSANTADVTLNYIAGGLGLVTGSCYFFKNSFTDKKATYNYDDDGVAPSLSKPRSGNSVWFGTGKTATGGELVYEMRINLKQYPQIAGVYDGFGHEGNSGAYHVNYLAFGQSSTSSRKYAYGQHGACNDQTGEAWTDGYSKGHMVPDGWVYLQCRISYIIEGETQEGYQRTPHGMVGIRTNIEGTKC